jgi:hypothetical protein
MTVAIKGAQRVSRTRQSRSRHAIAFLMAVTAPSCGGSPRAVTNGPYDLVEALSEATIQAPAADHVVSRTVTLRGEQQRGIFMHPNAQAEFPPVTLGDRAALAFAIGLDDSIRDKPGDGVDFTISVRQPDGNITEVWSKYIDSRKHDSDSGWQRTSVSLEKYAGQTVRLILRTSMAEDARFDWAYWGSPQLTSGTRR